MSSIAMFHSAVSGTTVKGSGAALGAVLGGVVGAVGNVLLYVVGAALGVTWAAEYDPGLAPYAMPWWIPAAVTLGPALVAAGVFAVAARFAGSRASTAIVAVSAAVFLLLLYAPFSVDGASAGTVFGLELMHVVAGLCIAGGALRIGARR